MNAWYQVATPREDILKDILDDSVFAADLADVLAERGPVEYRDPAGFFHQTYPTAGLVNLLTTVVRRIAQGVGDSVIQLQTPFGGGKTHALISLYHLFQHGNAHLKAPLVQRVLEQVGLERFPKVRIACFVGTKADALKGRTPWGELAYQLGVYERLREHDTRRRAPGGDLLHEILAPEPTLIMLDELVAYAVPAKDFADQILVFAQNLTETVSRLPHCALVATLPSSAPYGEEGERLLRELEQVFGRVQALYTPVVEDEFYHVIRQRLFREIKVPEAKRIVDEYYHLYQQHSHSLPEEVRSESYRDRMRVAYPFHPEVIDTLYDRWSTFSSFQRTRGVLKFLATVLSDLYRRQVSTPLILPVHLNLRNDALRQELLRHIGNEFAGVIHQDIAGDTALAEQIDKQLGSEYVPYRVASGLAAAIFFQSFSAGKRKGVTEPHLRLASLRPELPAHAIIGDALHKLRDKLWYLHCEDGLYAFQLKPNLNRILLDKEERIRNEEVDAALHEAIRKQAGNAFGAVYPFPERSQDIPDQKQLALAILAPRYPYGHEQTESLASELLERYGGQPRVYRNTLVVLAADTSELTRLQTLVKQRLALESIQNDQRLWQDLSNEDKHQVNSRLRANQESIPDTVLRVYRHFAMMRSQGVQWYTLGIPTAGERKTLSQRVRDHLKHADILADRLAPQYLLDSVVAHANEKPVKEMIEAFYRYPNFPMIESEQVVLEALARGVQEGLFGIRSGERLYYKESVPHTALEYDAVLVRAPAIAQTDTPTAKPPQSTSYAPGTVEEKAPVGIQSGEQSIPTTAGYHQGYQRYALRAVIPSSKASDFVQGVIAQIMRQAGVDFRFTIEFEVSGSLPRNLVDLTINETLKQIGAEIHQEQKE